MGATTAADSATDELSMVEGWAFKKGKKSVRFSENVRSFLHDVFIQGEETGIKTNAGDVASKMKNVRLAKGNCFGKRNGCRLNKLPDISAGSRLLTRVVS